MRLEEIINRDIKQAMIEKATDRLSAIRLIKASIQLEKSKKGKNEITDEDIYKLLSILINQSDESAEQYAAGGRIELVDEEIFRSTIFKTYLPEQLSEDEIILKIKKFINETGASSQRDMGKVMALANKNFAGKANMKIVSGIVKGMLS